MSENRYYACPNGEVTFKGQGWRVIDGQTGMDAESLWVGGYSEERARQLAGLLNLNARPSNVPQFEGNRWDVSGPELIVYVECDRPRDRAAPGIAGQRPGEVDHLAPGCLRREFSAHRASLAGDRRCFYPFPARLPASVKATECGGHLH
jgi:hypothetical protein